MLKEWSLHSTVAIIICKQEYRLVHSGRNVGGRGELISQTLHMHYANLSVQILKI